MFKPSPSCYVKNHWPHFFLCKEFKLQGILTHPIHSCQRNRPVQRVELLDVMPQLQLIPSQIIPTLRRYAIRLDKCCHHLGHFLLRRDLFLVAGPVGSKGNPLKGFHTKDWRSSLQFLVSFFQLNLMETPLEL